MNGGIKMIKDLLIFATAFIILCIFWPAVIILVPALALGLVVIVDVMEEKNNEKNLFD